MILDFVKKYFLTGVIMFFMIGIKFACDSYTNKVMPDKSLPFYWGLIFIWPYFFIVDALKEVRSLFKR